MKVATHPGNFHADDVFAVAVLDLAAGPLQIIRTRDERALAEADARVDVGGRSDPQAGDYDHHQKGGAGERPNGIRYASFGLAWKRYGAQLAGSPEAAGAIDERLVQGVDANDTGQELVKPLIDDVRPMSVSGVVASMNPAWDEELTAAEEDARFAEAVTLARTILTRQIAGAAGFQRARRLVLDAIRRAADPRIVELGSNMPWRETVVSNAPDALFVMYPKSDGWGLQAVPKAAGAFANRLSFPEQWRGLNGAELTEATGVGDAIFCHTAGFYASAESRDGVLELARRALDSETEND
jgi:uncharacterized UPF0160 family protein